MLGRKENNKVILKMKNGLTSESFSDFVKTCDKLAICLPPCDSLCGTGRRFHSISERVR